MRTNIVLNEDLVSKVLKLSGLHTKKDIVHIALKEYVKNHSKLDIRKLKGKIMFSNDYDYKKLRRG